MDMNEETVQRLASLVTEVLAEKGLMAAAPAAGRGTACSLPHGMAAAGPVPMEKKAGTPNPLVRAGADRVGHATEGAAPDGQCQTFAEFIDHTLLKPDATDAAVKEVCRQAREYKFASVCINPSHIAMVARELSGSGVKVCTVIGFPLGATTTESKAFETRDAVAKGAHEIDMVINVGKLKSGDYQFVANDIRAVVESAQGRTVKVIIETSLLNEDEKVAGCILSKAAGAHFVKTSTGFAGGGATAEDIALMRKIVGSDLGVKASGGIRDCGDAAKMLQAGASRLGASASVAIVSGKQGSGGY